MDGSGKKKHIDSLPILWMAITLHLFPLLSTRPGTYWTQSNESDIEMSSNWRAGKFLNSVIKPNGERHCLTFECKLITVTISSSSSHSFSSPFSNFKSCLNTSHPTTHYARVFLLQSGPWPKTQIGTSAQGQYSTSLPALFQTIWPHL